MSQTSRVGPYSHRNNPHTFTLAQLISCLILRASLKTTYRGVIEMLEASCGLRQRLGLHRLPHSSTLKKFASMMRNGCIGSAVRTGRWRVLSFEIAVNEEKGYGSLVRCPRPIATIPSTIARTCLGHHHILQTASQHP